MLRDYTYHLDRIDSILLKLEERGNEFFNNNIVLTNIFNLTNADNVKRDFESKVIGRSMYADHSLMTSTNLVKGRHWSRCRRSCWLVAEKE